MSSVFDCDDDFKSLRGKVSVHVCQSPSDCHSRAGGVHVPWGAGTFAKAGVKPSFRQKVRQLQNNSIAAIGLCGLLCLVKPSIHVAS